MKTANLTEWEQHQTYLDGVFGSGHPRIQDDLVDSEEGRSILLAYASTALSAVTELVHEFGREVAFRQHLQSIVSVDLPYWFHRALCIAFRNSGSKPNALSERRSVWAWKAFKRHQESGFDDWHYPGARALEELERTIEEILQVATDENVALLRRGRRARDVSSVHLPAQGRADDTVNQPGAERAWVQKQAGGMPLRGWKKICGHVGVENDRGNRDRLKRLNDRTGGPIRWCGYTPEVDPGELKAWVEDTEARDEASRRLREDKAFAKQDLGERDGAHAQDYGAHIKRRAAR